MGEEQQAVVMLRKSKDLLFRDIDDELLREFLNFSHAYARGNKLYALRILLYNTKDSLINRLENLEIEVAKLKEQPSEESKKKIPKTFGGVI